MPESDHYGVDVQRMVLRIECGDHAFERDGALPGPCICPECGRRFTLTWGITIEPSWKAGISGLPEPGAVIRIREDRDYAGDEAGRYTGRWYVISTSDGVLGYGFFARPVTSRDGTGRTWFEGARVEWSQASA